MTELAISALRALVRSERAHARRALARLAASDHARRVKGETIASYEWRQARRHLAKARRAEAALSALRAQ